MLRVIHTADTHIGYRQYHSDERRRDFLTAFEAVVEDAIDDDVDAVVHAGDLFHDKRPDLRDLQGTIAALGRLRRADIPFLGIVGNHERKRDAQWLDLFADLGLAERLGREPNHLDGVALYGLDYLTPAARTAGAADFAPPGEADVAMLVGHGIIEGLPYGDWDLDALLETAAVDFDAVLLGDYHEHELERRDGVVVTYSGSTERASADEQAPRGYNVVTVDGGDVAVSHRTLPETRPFVYVPVELHGDEGEARVIEHLTERDLEDAVAIVTIEGAGEAISTATIEAHARDAGALIARVRDRRTGGDAAGGAEVSVHFADPDWAVRDALSSTSVSEAAYELDGIVRDGAIPDSRVREQARELVGELLEDDPEALTRPADVDAPETDTDADAQAATADDGDGDVAAATAREDPSGGDDKAGSPGPADEQPPTEDDEAPDDGEAAIAAGDGQASMEDYL